MGYKGSYVWSVRQKAGKMRIVTATVDVVVRNAEGKILLVKVKSDGKWATVGGHVELGDTWAGAAIKELLEEGGIVAKPQDLVPYGVGSGGVFSYPDGSTQAMSLLFACDKYEKVELTDEEEIAEAEWFTLEEVKQLDLRGWAREIITAYEKWLVDGKFRQIEVRQEFDLAGGNNLDGVVGE